MRIMPRSVPIYWACGDFPSQIVAAVALHHTPSQRGDAGFSSTVFVHIADRLVHRGPGLTRQLDLWY